MTCRVLMVCIACLCSGLVNAASPYDNLGFALKQQQIITDLRQHCVINSSVSDEQIRTTFLNSEYNHAAITQAAQAFDKKDKHQYEQAIGSIRCPAM